MSKNTQLQDPFLNTLRTQKMAVHIYLVNGIKLAGTIESFDNFVIILSCNKNSQMVYKHAISTIVPSEKIDMSKVRSKVSA